MAEVVNSVLCLSVCVLIALALMIAADDVRQWWVSRRGRR